jgi:cytochrome P450
MVFVLAMVLNPHVQKRAQAEIDALIGRDRLPTFEDRASLPYIDAIVRETFRWEPVVPLGTYSSSSSPRQVIGLCTDSDDDFMCRRTTRCLE